MNLPEAEIARLDSLLERFELTRYRDAILQQASPCVAIALEDPPVGAPHELPAPPVGASKVGGKPDLPPDLAWPEGPDGHAGFFLQIALADVCARAWKPLPSQGMVYLFCFNDAATYWDPPGWQMLYWSGPVTALAPAIPPGEIAATVCEQSFFLDSVSRPLLLREATDFPPGCSGDWAFLNGLEDLGKAANDPDVLQRFFEFAEHAADPGLEADRARGRGPYFHPIGRLYGHTSARIREDLTLAERGLQDFFSDYDWRREHAEELARDGAAWRQVLRLASNPATGYMGPSDAAPVSVLAKDPGTRPWIPVGPVYGLSTN